MAASIAVESDPPGAEARASNGAQSCRTPCKLAVAADGPFTVTVSLNGYIPQAVPVRIVQPDDPRLGSDVTAEAGARLDPNPVFVELERAPTPVPPATPVKKRKPRPATAAARAPTTTAAVPSAVPPPAPAQQPAPAPAPPPANSPPPWPMPR